MALLIVILSFGVTMLLCELWDIVNDKTKYSSKLTKIKNIIVDFVCIFLMVWLEFYYIAIKTNALKNNDFLRAFSYNTIK